MCEDSKRSSTWSVSLLLSSSSFEISWALAPLEEERRVPRWNEIVAALTSTTAPRPKRAIFFIVGQQRQGIASRSPHPQSNSESKRGTTTDGQPIRKLFIIV